MKGHLPVTCCHRCTGDDYRHPIGHRRFVGDDSWRLSAFILDDHQKRSSLLQGLNEDNGEPDTESLGLDKLFEECSVDGNDYISPDELDKLEENPLPEIQDPLECNACFPDPLPLTRAGRERKRPQYLFLFIYFIIVTCIYFT